MGSGGFPQDCPRGRTSGRHLQVPPEPLPNRMADRRREEEGHPPQGRKGGRLVRMEIQFQIDLIGCSELKLSHRQYRMQDKMEGRMTPARKSGTRTRCPLWEFTLHAVGRGRQYSSKGRVQSAVENYHENRCNKTGNHHHRETYTHPFLSGDWIGSALTN